MCDKNIAPRQEQKPEQILDNLFNILDKHDLPLTWDHLPIITLESSQMLVENTDGYYIESSTCEKKHLCALLLWGKSLVHNDVYPLTEEQSIDSLIKCFRIAARHGAYSVAASIGDQLVLTKCSNIIGVYSADNLLFAFSKLLKLEGRFEDAVKVNLCAASIAANDNSESGEFSKAKVLLNLGKAVHSHQWRTGYYHAFSKLSINRLKLLQKRFSRYQPYSVARFLAIALDCQAQIYSELVSADMDEEYYDKKNHLLHICDLWDEAENQALKSQVYNTYNRIKLRRIYSIFSFIRTSKICNENLREFGIRVNNTNSEYQDLRAIGVRMGQYAEMLSFVGRFAEANDRITSAIEAAQRTFDWRTLAQNYIRQADILVRSNTTNKTIDIHLEAIRWLELACIQLDKLKEPLPALHVQLRRKLAKHYRLCGQAENSERSLDEAFHYIRNIQNRLREEAQIDFSQNLGNRKQTIKWSKDYVPNNMLNDKEVQSVTDSLIVDWDLLASLQEQIFSEIKMSANLIRHEQTQRIVSQSLNEFKALTLHKTRRIIDIAINTIGASLSEEFGNDCKTRDRICQRTTEFLRKTSTDASESLATQLRIIDYHNDEPQWHSVSDLVNMATSYKSLYQGLGASDIQNRIDQDFKINGYQELFVEQLSSLIMNAARESGQGNVKASVLIIVSCMIDVIKGNFGCITIRDTGGKVKELTDALEITKSVQCMESRSSGGLGLPIASNFFRRFGGDITVAGKEGIHTDLMILLPKGPFVSLMD